MKSRLMLWLMLAGISAAGVVQIAPTADAYVDSRLTAVNFGSETLLKAQGYAAGAGSFLSARRVYLKFALADAGLPAGAIITGATVGVWLEQINVGTYNASDPWGYLHYVADDGWSESAIVWSNAPTPTLPAIEEVSKPLNDTGQYIEWDLFSGAGFNWLNYADDVADGFISLALILNTEDFNNYAHFHSRENVNPPYLKITYEIPEPATLLLLCVGCVVRRCI